MLQKRIVRTNFDIYVYISTTDMFQTNMKNL